ncbi:Ferrichrome siderophore peptide synthetase [Seminavis robusta]|uniref:Ferrichrome siderophore peptide synthetase n=1 Tax=Seminavis robusta TaxID=568900 RepID=A0A9N8HWR7_9STRA|nr:Ferrichrome siderophore peptide synthetase [Seminavis robusta]|eukprot:Sro2249_g320770.1 Ferrichrome siderophore peptide synthetase (711) ;mRNA; f:14243-16375
MKKIGGAMTSEDDGHGLSRPAIVWSKGLVEQSGRSNCDYWMVDFLLDFPLQGPSTADATSQNQLELRSLSYGTVLLLTSHIVYLLQRKIEEIVSSSPSVSQKDDPSLTAIPLAVAIPEGPFLPLAILAVHALNVPFSICKNSCSKDAAYAFLIPIEPGEGKDRIRHMLAETQPAVILCLEPDRQRLQDIVESLRQNDETAGNQSGASKGALNTEMFQAKTSTIFDFASLAREAATASRSLLEENNSTRQSLMDQLQSQWSGVETLQTVVAQFSRRIRQQESSIILPQSTTTTTTTNRLSHVAYTSGSTGQPKGSLSSINSLHWYINEKNRLHGITRQSTVLLASAVSFDPCLSDILATFQARATLGMATRADLSQNLATVLATLGITHVLCTPTLWSTMMSSSSHDSNNRKVTAPKDDFAPHSSLQLVALGGEPIPKQIVQTWARRTTPNNNEEESSSNPASCRLFATYGVTEACVYQTMGEITTSTTTTAQRGQNVGQPFGGIHVRICKEEDQETLVDVLPSDNIGEVVLYGSQLDEWSSYWNRPEQSQLKFVRLADSSTVCYYRTGDRGYIEHNSGDLIMLGRIGGEEGMMKINGVRVELGEIEAALVDDRLSITEGLEKHDGLDLPVIVNAAVVAGTTTMDEEQALRNSMPIVSSAKPVPASLEFVRCLLGDQAFSAIPAPCSHCCEPGAKTRYEQVVRRRRLFSFQ